MKSDKTSHVINFIQKTQYFIATKQDKQQAIYEFQRGLDYYNYRLKVINFIGYNHVLDAGCGFGQYSFILSQHNKKVSAIDLNRNYIEIARSISKLFNSENISFNQGDLHKINANSQKFDAIFCYGVLMYTKENEVLKEFSRILKPGGQLYICSDGPGLPFYKIITLGIKKLELRPILSGINLLIQSIWVNGFRKYILYPTFMTKNNILKLLKSNNFTVQYYGPDGSYGNLNNKYFTAHCGKTYFGLPHDYEIIATKNA